MAHYSRMPPRIGPVEKFFPLVLEPRVKFLRDDLRDSLDRLDIVGYSYLD